MAETMSPKERVGAYLTGQPVDHVPCVPLLLNHAARCLGVTIRQYATDGTVMGRSHVAAFRRYRYDLISIFADTAITAEALGTRLEFPEDDVARVVQPIVAKPDDLEKVQPVDARRAGRLPLYLEAIRHCNREIGGEVVVACCYPAPISTAAALRGTDQFARDLIRNKALAHALLERSLKLVVDYAEAVAEAGGIPVLVDPVASGSLISRAAFAEFGLPYLTKAIAKIASLGFPTVLHICGKTSNMIDLMADTGAMVLSIDAIELSEARQKVGHRVCLMGNVQPGPTLLGGTADDVRREARQCLADCKTNPRGFILATGCEVPIDTPPANIVALMETAREFG